MQSSLRQPARGPHAGVPVASVAWGLVAALAAIVLLGLAACSLSEQDKVAKRVEDYYRAMGRQDWAKACSFVFNLQAKKPYEQDPALQAQCGQEMAKFNNFTPEALASLQGTRVKTAAINGETAVVKKADLGNILAAEPEQRDVTLRLVAGQWYIDNQ